jgi:hypothetical protein
MKEAPKIVFSKHMNIPIDFSRYVLKNRLIKEARLYAYLSFTTSGNFAPHRLERQKILVELGVKKWETLNRHMNRLKTLGWIYPKHGVLFLKSFAAITEEFGINTVMGALFDPPDFSKFKAFLIAASITYRVRRNHWGRLKAKGPLTGRSTGTTASSSLISHHGEDPLKVYLTGGEISNLYLGNNLSLSLTSGHNYKRIAENAGYIIIEKRCIPTELKISARMSINKYYSELGNRLRISKGHLFIQCSDIITSSIHLRRNRAIREIKCNSRKRDVIW